MKYGMFDPRKLHIFPSPSYNKDHETWISVVIMEVCCNSQQIVLSNHFFSLIELALKIIPLVEHTFESKKVPLKS